MSRKSAALAVSMAAVCVIVASCGAPSTAASPRTDASKLPSATPREAGVTELDRSREPLPPGRYTRADFTPRVTFEIAGGEWYAEQLFTGFFDIQQDVGSPDVIAVQFARPSSVFGEGGRNETVTTAEDAVVALRAHPGLTILGESTSRVGGSDGFVIEVEHAGAGYANVSIMMVPPGPLSIAPDRRLWIAFVDTEDGLLAVMVGGSVARWDEALAAAEPVLESVTIGD